MRENIDMNGKYAEKRKNERTNERTSKESSKRMKRRAKEQSKNIKILIKTREIEENLYFRYDKRL